MHRITKFSLVLFSGAALAWLLNLTFLKEIGEWLQSGDQSHYLLDAYYYWHQGGALLQRLDRMSAITALQRSIPTSNSFGVVIFAALSQAIGIGLASLPLLNASLIYFAARPFFRKTPFAWLLAAAILIGTAPLPFLVAKEALLYLGILTLLNARRTENKFHRYSTLMSGILLISLGRFQILLFLFLARLLSKSTRETRLLLLSSVLLLLALLYRPLYNQGLQSQTLLLNAGSATCEGLMHYTCLGQANALTVLIARIAAISLLPAKWLYAALTTFEYAENPFKAWITLSQGIFLLFFSMWLYKIRKGIQQTRLSVHRQQMSFALWYGAIYIMAYSLVLFDQPTRQLQFALGSAAIIATSSLRRNPRGRLAPHAQGPFSPSSQPSASLASTTNNIPTPVHNEATLQPSP